MQLKVPFLTKQVSVWHISIGLLLLLGFVLRLSNLGYYPYAVNQDELSNIYDGYSIAQTGADRWGQKYPMILRGFGTEDYRPPMYAWLSALPIGIFGFSVANGRLVSAVLGCISLILIYLVGKRISGRLFAVVALLLAVLSPWHILFSRMASEGTMLPPFFLIAACYLWQKSYDKHYSFRSLFLLGLCVGLGTNTYQASKLIFFLFAVWVLTDLWQRAGKIFISGFVFGLGCLVGAMPQLIVVITMFNQSFSRANSVMLKYSFSFDYVNSLLNNIFHNLSPEYLFFSFGKYNNLSIGRLLMPEFIFFYIGLFFIGRIANKDQAIKPVYIYLLIFTVIIPGALTIDNPHALRTSGLAVLLPMISAAGVVFVYQNIKQKYTRNVFLLASVGLFILNGIYYTKVYAKSFDLRNAGMQSILTVYSEKLNQYQDYYDTVLIEDFGNQAYIYVAAFSNVTPQAFQQADKQMDKWGMDHFKKLDKYYFLSQEDINKKLQEGGSNKLVVQHIRNNACAVIDSVEVNGEKVFFYNCKPSRQ